MSDAAAAVVSLYDRHAATWDRARGRSLFERGWLDRFRSLVRPGGTILDLGCGSSEPIGRYLIEAGHRLTGIDSSPSMIALCRARFPAGDWQVADMRTLALGRTFDGLLAWDSFFHLDRDEQRRMFGLFAAHAAPGAALMFTSGPGDGVAIGDFQGEPLHHASLDSVEYRRLLAENGFTVAAHVAEDPSCGGHTIWLARNASYQ